MTGPSGSGEHVGEAVLYAADKELVGVAGPFLRAGLAAGDAVLLVCTDRRNALLTEAVEHDPRLTVLPVPQVWRRPTEAMADYQSLIEEQAAVGRRLWVVADADHGSGPVEWSEWARFEAASHHASAPYPVRSLCLVDRREAPAQVVAAVRRVHPLLWTDGVRARSPDHAEPAENICRDAYVRSDPMEAASPTLQVGGVTGAADLSRVRHALGAELAREDLPPWRTHEFLLAVGEVVSNAVSHGRPPVAVRFWSTPRRLLCTVTDLGAGFDFPLSCYLPLDLARTGLGLYLVRQLCDQVNVCWTPDGFTVRLTLVRA